MKDVQLSEHRDPRFLDSRWTRLSALAALVLIFGIMVAPAAITLASAEAQGDPVNGKAIYTATCLACHGESAEGKRDLNSPALFQQEGWYIVAQLKKFRDGLRGADPKDTGGMIMRPMAQALQDDKSILDVTAYINSLTGPDPANEIEGDVAAGATQYNMVCAACHGPDARGKPELFSPALAGQNDWYVVAQLKKFKEGLRGSDPKDITGLQMKGMAATLATDEAINNVAAYLATLPR